MFQTFSISIHPFLFQFTLFYFNSTFFIHSLVYFNSAFFISIQPFSFIHSLVYFNSAFFISIQPFLFIHWFISIRNLNNINTIFKIMCVLLTLFLNYNLSHCWFGFCFLFVLFVYGSRM